MQVNISIPVEVRDNAEAERVKASLTHIVNLNGATGVLNLYDELKNNVLIRSAVTAVAKKLRKDK